MAPNRMRPINLCQLGGCGRVSAKWRIAFGLIDRTAGRKSATVCGPFKIKHAPLAVLGLLKGTFTLTAFLIYQ